MSKGSVVALAIAITYGAIAISLLVYFTNGDLAVLELASPNWWLLLLASAIELLNRLLFGLGWVWLVEESAGPKKPRRGNLFSVFAMSWLARYIPGTGTWMALRVMLARRTGVGRGTLSLATFNEGVVQIVMLSLLGSLALALGADGGISWGFGQATLWVIIISGLLLLHPRIIQKALVLLAKLFNRPDSVIPQTVATHRLPRVAGLYAMTSLLSSMGILFVGLSLSPELGNKWVDLILIATLSSLASILAFFIPAGLGVREGALVAGLSPFIGAPEALLIAVTHRVLSVVWDVLFLLVVKIARLLHR